MDGACDMRGRDDKCIQNFSRGTMKGRDHAEDLDINGMIILNGSCEIGWEGVDSIHVLQDNDRVAGG
jgi:hypothetical protein